MKGKLEGQTWWPLYALPAILGALLFWEVSSPLPLFSAQIISFAALVLLFCGIALWLIFGMGMKSSE